MSEKITKMRRAQKLAREMLVIVEEYERGTVVGAGGVEYPLTNAQVTVQKQAFAARRTELIQTVESITAQ